jgi:hypothetical protein
MCKKRRVRFGIETTKDDASSYRNIMLRLSLIFVPGRFRAGAGIRLNEERGRGHGTRTAIGGPSCLALVMAIYSCISRSFRRCLPVSCGVSLGDGIVS